MLDLGVGESIRLVFWSMLCLGGVAALLAFSYRRLLELRRWQRWAAPHLQRARGEASGLAGSTQSTPEELSEATSELRWQLRQPSLVPRGCAKAAFWLGTAVALMQAGRQLGSADTRDWMGPVVSLASGCIGAMGCSFIGRVAEAEAQHLRDAWNTLIRRSTRDVAT
jgi:hypothetical protein